MSSPSARRSPSDIVYDLIKICHIDPFESELFVSGRTDRRGIQICLPRGFRDAASRLADLLRAGKASGTESDRIVKGQWS